MTDEELAEKLAEAFDAAVEKVKADVNKMEKCVRKHGLTSHWRKITGDDDALPEVRWAHDAHATVVLDDEGAVVRYVTFHNPFHADSTSLRFEVTVHEHAHHVYYAREGEESADHPEAWDDIRVAIQSNARFCRGGG